MDKKKCFAALFLCTLAIILGLIGGFYGYHKYMKKFNVNQTNVMYSTENIGDYEH